METNSLKKRLERMDPSERRECLLYQPSFLAKANRSDRLQSDRLQKLLMDFEFISAKALAYNPELLIADYNLALDFLSDVSGNKVESLKLIRDSISLSLGALTDDPNQLAGQLIGHLAHYPLLESRSEEPKSLLSLSKISESIILVISILIMSPLLIGSFIFIVFNVLATEILIRTKLKKRTRRTFQLAGNILSKTISILSHLQVNLGNIVTVVRMGLIDIPLFLYYEYFHDGPLKLNIKMKSSNVQDKHREKLSHIEEFLDQVERFQFTPWLRPLTPSLTIPGGELVGFLYGFPQFSISRSIVISPDGKYVFADADNGRLAIWDLNNTTPPKILSGHKSQVTCIAVKQNIDHSLILISGSQDNTLIYWDIETGSILKTFIGHTATVNAVAIFTDFQTLRPYIISGSHDKNLIIWDLQSGEKLHILTDHAKGINEISVTPDGKKMVSASDDETLIVWDLQEKLALHVLRGHNKYVTSAVITLDGNRVISGSAGDGDIFVWDLHSGEIIGRNSKERNSIDSIAIIPNSQKIVVVSSNDRIDILDISKFDSMGSVLFRPGNFIRDIEYISTIAATPDGKFLISDSIDDLRIWDLNICQEQKVITGHNDSVNSIAITPDNQYAITASSDHTLRLWELSSGTPLKSFENSDGSVKWVSITADGKRIVSLANEITIWDLRTGLFKQFENRTEANIAALSSKDNLTLWGGREIITLDLNTGKEVEHLTKDVDFEDRNPGDAIGFTLNEDRLIFSSHGNVVVWDYQTGNKIAVLRGWNDYMSAIAIAPDGKICASTVGKFITLWDFKTYNYLRQITGHTGEVKSLIISANGQYLVSTSDDKTIRIWEFPSGKEVLRFTGESSIVSCALSPDGKTIVAGELMGRVHFLRLENFESSLTD